MDVAAMAAASDPDQNWQFIRRWTDPPPLKRRSPALGGSSNRADFVSSSKPTNTPADAAAQRACAVVLRRAARLDHLAGLLLSIGQRPAAARLASIADELREAVAP
jgi:hypothetical protein